MLIYYITYKKAQATIVFNTLNQKTKSPFKRFSGRIKYKLMNKLKKKNRPDVSIILPCRNEEQALPFCLNKIKEVIKKNNLSAEIIVSDSSTDKSPEIAKKEKVILLKHDREGYGAAYLEAFKIAKGKYIFMADADASYDFEEISNFIKQLKKGYDMVIGDRFSGKMHQDAMTFSHKYIGNPILSFILRLFFKNKINDSQCGMRAIKKSAVEKLNLQTTGMEFASEMIIKALKNNLKIKELTIDYYPRIGSSKIRSFSDAWKHIRFMLLYSPLFLFFIPGLIFFVFGIFMIVWLYYCSPQIFGVKLFYHPMFFSSGLIIIGYQLITFSAFAKIYSITHLKEHNEKIEKMFKYITIERASILGLMVSLVGVVIYFLIFAKWINSSFGSLNEIKNSIVALTFIVLGVQTIFSSFMFSILGIKEK
ncbi:MAG: glycosyltransferase [Candidatus Staskawiczbacteria bacterium]|nr:glycosyltransferase [Candidatus Staskawiczbacteria bacterium]